jgi:hypothetical protein
MLARRRRKGKVKEKKETLFNLARNKIFAPAATTATATRRRKGTSEGEGR